MKIGDRLRCTRSDCHTYFQVGFLYPIVGFDGDNDPILRDHRDEVGPVGCPLDGNVWSFEFVNEDEQTLALLELLRLSQEDVKAGRVMTREQLIESLSKD